MSHHKIREAARQRMAETGESYSTARRRVIAEHEKEQPVGIRQRQQATVSPSLGTRADAPPLSPVPGEPVQDDDGTIECPTCEGDGTIRGGGVVCPSCGGKGQVPDDAVTSNSAPGASEGRGVAMSEMPGLES